MGLCQRDIRNSHIAYNRTLYLYFLDTKFKLLRICCSQLYSEETIVFLCWRPCWAHFGRFGAITPVNNVRLSWNFDHKESSLLYKCHLKSFENLKFLQRQDIPKIWAFGPTLTPIYPQKMAKIRYSHWLSRSIKIISFQFSMKIIISLCTVWVFFRVQMGPGSMIKMSQLKLTALFQKPLIKG